MTEPRYETWLVNVLVEQRAELRWVPNEHKAGEHLELEAPGEYRIDLGSEPFAQIIMDALGAYREDLAPDFHVAARIEDGEIVLWLERRPVKQQPVGPEPDLDLRACPYGCGQAVQRAVWLTKELPCPRCGGMSIGRA